MTKEEAISLKSFENYCNCGGSADLDHHCDHNHPHLYRCAQYKEFEEWRALLSNEEFEAIVNPQPKAKTLRTKRGAR